MEQQETDRQSAILKQVLANLADKRLHIYELQNLVNYHPQSNLLYMLIARAGDTEQIKSAAVYYNSPALYTLVHQPGPLPLVNPGQIINLDDIEPQVLPVQEQFGFQGFENYQPTVEDLALAEINKRKFGSETNWASFDPDAEEIQEQLYEPGEIAYQPDERQLSAETISPDAEPTAHEAEPLESEEPVWVVPDVTWAQQQVFPEAQEFVNSLQQDRHRQQEDVPEQVKPVLGQESYQPTEEFNDAPPQVEETQPYEQPAVSTASQWQSLNFEEFDKHQPVAPEAETVNTAINTDLIGVEPEIFTAQPEQPITAEQSILEEQTEQTAGIEPEVLGAVHDVLPVEEQSTHAVTFEDKTASAFVPYMQKAEQELLRKETFVEPGNNAGDNTNVDTAGKLKPQAGSEIEDEIFDEIIGIEDIFIAHVPKPVPLVVPPSAAAGQAEQPVQQQQQDVPLINADEVVQRVEQAAAETPVAEEIPVPQEVMSNVQQHEPQATLANATDANAVQEPQINQPQPAEPETSAHTEPVAEFDSLIAENIVSADYFSYRRSLVKEEPAPVAEQPVQPPAEIAEEKQVVTKYHDDTMPYTFLWWLDKTRRDHSSVYQPYAKPVQLPAIDELQQEQQVPKQLIEPKHKEEDIIERFIKEEPQIKPPSSDKLDNENKARNSAEDSDELVTETLARIYMDQMLYHKAIATYKKLMLRFPEKNSYFAGQIKELENKIN